MHFSVQNKTSEGYTRQKSDCLGQNHRMIKVGKDFWKSSCSIPLLIQICIKRLPRTRLLKISEEETICSSTLPCTQYSSTYRCFELELRSFSSCPLTLGITEKAYLCPLCILHLDINKIPSDPALLQEEISQLSQHVLKGIKVIEMLALESILKITSHSSGY